MNVSTWSWLIVSSHAALIPSPATTGPVKLSLSGLGWTLRSSAQPVGCPPTAYAVIVNTWLSPTSFHASPGVISMYPSTYVFSAWSELSPVPVVAVSSPSPYTSADACTVTTPGSLAVIVAYARPLVVVVLVALTNVAPIGLSTKLNSSSVPSGAATHSVPSHTSTVAVNTCSSPTSFVSPCGSSKIRACRYSYSFSAGSLFSPVPSVSRTRVTSVPNSIVTVASAVNVPGELWLIVSSHVAIHVPSTCTTFGAVAPGSRSSLLGVGEMT